MTQPLNEATSSRGRRNRAIVAVLVAVVLILCILPFCIIAILTLLGPQIGGVFSEILREIGTPVP